MRSRYSAYALGLIDYLVATTLPAQQAKLDRAGIAAWSAQSTWLGLEVLRHTPLADGRHAQVAFIARWSDTAGQHNHQELSAFVRTKDTQDNDAQGTAHWYFLDPTVKLGTSRNDSCPCGLGLKFKKCCGQWIS